MSDTLLAKRYAQALFDLSQEIGKTEEVKDDMALLTEVILSNRSFKLFLKSPVIRSDKKNKVIEEIFQGKVQEITERFFRLIIKHKREDHLEGIAAQFLEIYKEYHHIVTAQVTTPVELTDELRGKIAGLVEEYTKGKVELVEKIDESILGGFIVRFGDREYDASLINQINELKKDFEDNQYIKKF